MNEEIALQVAAVLFAAVLGLVLARRFGQPAVLGEILLGVLIGPTLLGIAEYNEIVRVLAELGAIFLLFMVGLQCNIKSIYTVKNAVVASVGAAIPFLLGWFVAQAFGFSSIESMFIAVALSATSIAVTAHVLQERGLLSEEYARIILGAAVLDDIISLFALSILSGVPKGFSWNAIGTQGVLVLTFVVGAFLIMPLVNKLIHYIDESMSTRTDHQVTIFTAMIIAFGYAGVAEFIGLSSIVGAFLAGVSIDQRHLPRLRQGSRYFEILFSGIFFVSLGVLLDITAMKGMWGFTLLITLIAIFSKVFGAMIPAWMFKRKLQEAFTIGVGMVPRGEVTMIVGLLGFTTGAISAGVYSAIILVAFLTSVVTPPMLSAMLPRKG